MEKNIDLRKIVEKLKEPYGLASNHASCFTHQFWMGFYYATGAAIWQMEKVLGQKEENLQTFSRQLYETFPDTEEGQFALPALKKMKRFYLTYQDDFMDKEIGDAICKVRWQHHTRHLCKIADPQERHFYLLNTVKNNWTCKTLGKKIKNDYYRNLGYILSNFDTTLPPELSRLAQSIFQKAYALDFIKANRGEATTEKELEGAIETNVGKFLKILGSGFSYKGCQCQVEWEGKKYVYDVVLRHDQLQCYIIIELKREKFKPEYIGKMNRYLYCANQIFNDKSGNNAIGILLCRSADDPSILRDLMNSRLPIGVATYQLDI